MPVGVFKLSAVGVIIILLVNICYTNHSYLIVRVIRGDDHYLIRIG